MGASSKRTFVMKNFEKGTWKLFELNGAYFFCTNTFTGARFRGPSAVEANLANILFLLVHLQDYIVLLSSFLVSTVFLLNSWPSLATFFAWESSTSKWYFFTYLNQFFGATFYILFFLADEISGSSTSLSNFFPGKV